MFLGIVTLLVAISISAIAAYYSIIGLTAIFAAAFLPIVLMGSVLEVGKIVTAIWLHTYWNKASFLIKTYLTTAVVVLMFITSMGIFGFLSKSHIEQTSAGEENVAQVQQIQAEIARYENIVDRAEQKIQKLQTSGTGADQTIQAQIDKEQERINTAYDRVNPAIESTQKQLADDTATYNARIASVEKRISELQTAKNIDTTNKASVKRLQQLVGAKPDGAYGSSTARLVKGYELNLKAEKQQLYDKIEELKTASKEEIRRLRQRAEKEIDASNELINRLRSQLGKDTGTDIESEIDEQNTKIRTANDEIDKLTTQKFGIQSQYRKLEAEVGPIKYIAEFIYGDNANKNMLEEAVRWVIIIIVAVFDPLAVCLVLAGVMSIGWARTKKQDFNFNEYEQQRAAKISANTGPFTEDPRIEELEMELQKHNDYLAEIEKLLDGNLSNINPEKYQELEAEKLVLVDERDELANAVAVLKNENDNLVDKVVSTESERDDYKAKIDAIAEGVTDQETRITTLLTQIADLEAEIERRDAVVIKMAEKYQLVEKDEFAAGLEAQVQEEVVTNPELPFDVETKKE